MQQEIKLNMVKLLRNNSSFRKKYFEHLKYQYQRYLKEYPNLSKQISIQEVSEIVEALKSHHTVFINELMQNPGYSRDSFRAEHPLEFSILLIFWGTFKALKDAILEAHPISILRENIDIVIKYDKSQFPKKYFISCAIAGQDLDEEALKTVRTWCTHNKAELKLLLMRGSHIDDGYPNHFLEKFASEIVTEIDVCSCLKAIDFQVYPQMIVPLTGLHRFGQKKHSVIVAAPKQLMNSVARGKKKFPHIIYSTGTLCSPNYKNLRTGRIAAQDHTLGGLIVEVLNDSCFFIRNVEIDSSKGFNDFDNYYCGNSVKKQNALCYSLGDMHYGIEDKDAVNCAKRIISRVKPTYVTFNDLCDNRSISHHELHQIVTKYNYSGVQTTLKEELDHTAQELKKWVKEFPTTKFIVIPSNHDDFIIKWLNTGEFAKDVRNARIGAELFIAALDKQNPMEYYFKKHHSIKSIKFLKRDDELNLLGCEHNSHGDRGNNGAKGSPRGMELSYGKCVVGHGHTPFKFRDVIGLGTNSILDPDYTVGSASGWLHADAIQYKNGTRQLIIKIFGNYSIDDYLETSDKA